MGLFWDGLANPNGRGKALGVEEEAFFFWVNFFSHTFNFFGGNQKFQMVVNQVEGFC